MTKKIIHISFTYLLLFIFGYLAKQVFYGISLDFLWIVYLPIATCISIITFDLISNYVNFELINDLKEDHKSQYIIALAILSAGFAIATAIFLK